MTVIGDVYTFVADHPIPAEDEIIFGATDRLIINADVVVTLEGKLYVIDETDGITRITVNGRLTMDEGSEIEICGITNSGIGISVNTGGEFTQNGGDIRITTVVGTGDPFTHGILVAGAGAVFNANGGTIQIGTVTTASGIDVRDDGLFTQNGTDITITNVANSGIGIVVFNTGAGLTATYTQTTGNITFEQLTNFATAIEMISDSTFTKANVPTISIINLPAGGGTSGMVVTGTIDRSVVTNLGPDDTIDMTNSDIPYTPALALADPLVAPWDGGASFRDFYAP
ncbi:MAG: hypothetical protein ACR2M6_03290 [Vampirovibrionia bacterium]